MFKYHLFICRSGGGQKAEAQVVETQVIIKLRMIYETHPHKALMHCQTRHTEDRLTDRLYRAKELQFSLFLSGAVTTKKSVCTSKAELGSQVLSSFRCQVKSTRVSSISHRHQPHQQCADN